MRLHFKHNVYEEYDSFTSSLPDTKNTFYPLGNGACTTPSYQKTLPEQFHSRRTEKTAPFLKTNSPSSAQPITFIPKDFTRKDATMQRGCDDFL